MAENNSLKERLVELGATEAQLKSKVVTLMEDSMIDDEALRSETVRKELAELHRQTKDAGSQTEKYRRSLYLAQKEMSDLRKNIQAANTFAIDSVISNESVKDGVIAYKRMLESTRDVFGADAMTEEVVCKAIEAASYGMWRSVMGPKSGSDQNRGWR